MTNLEIRFKKENSENPQGLEVEIWALLNRRTSWESSGEDKGPDD